MIRTYSLLRALHTDWKIHFLVLHNSREPISKTCVNEFCSMFSNVTLKEYGGPLVASNLVEKFRAEGKYQGAVTLRDQLKRLVVGRVALWLANLPLNLYLLIKKYANARRFVRNQLESAPFDAVLLDYTKMAYLAPVIRRYQVTKILNVHNAESELAHEMMLTHKNGIERRQAWFDWQVYKYYEKYYVPKFNLLLAPTEADAVFHSKFGRGGRVVVFPNGVDTSVLRPLPPPEQPVSIIFPGRMDYPPNAQAMSFFCKQILPRVAVTLPSVQFYIVGKKPPPNVRALQSDRVVVTGYVEDVLPFWRKASALVVPLSIGGGTRIKILEAMALERPVVSTSKGCEGLEVAHRKHLLIADDPKEFAECVIQVLRKPAQFHEMVLAARRLVEEKYSFTTLAAMLHGALEESGSEV